MLLTIHVCGETDTGAHTGERKHSSLYTDDDLEMLSPTIIAFNACI